MLSQRGKNAVSIGILSALVAFGPLCTDIYLSSLPDISAFYQASPAQTQMSLTSCFIGLALGQIVIGPVSDARGRRGPLLLSLAIFTLTSLLCSLATDINFMIAFRFLQGLSGAGGMVLARSIAADKFQGSALTSFMALLMAINSVTPVLGPVVGSLIVTFFKWQAVFYMLCSIGLLLLLFSFFFIEETHLPQPGNGGVSRAVADMFRELGNLKFLWFTVSLSFVMGGFFGYISASPFVLQVRYGLSPLGFSVCFGTVAVCIALTSTLTGRISRRVGEQQLMRRIFSLMLLAALGVLFLAFFPPDSFIPLLLCLIVFCSMMGASQTVGFTVLMEVKKGQAGAASGIYGVMTFFFGAMASPFMGVMGEQSIIPLGVCLFSCSLLAIASWNAGIKASEK